MDKGIKKPLNEIRIGFKSRVRNIITYCTILLKENNFRTLYLSAIGGAIGSLVNVVEVLKISNPGLYQVNKLGTISYQTVDQRGGVLNQRLYPKLEVTLTLDPPQDVNSEGYQDKLTEEERNALLKVTKERREFSERRDKDEDFEGDEWEPRQARGSFRGWRGRGNLRGGFRGRRGRGFQRFEERSEGPRFEERREGPRFEERRGGPRFEERRGGQRFEERRGGQRFEERRGGFRGGWTTRRFNRGRGY